MTAGCEFGMRCGTVSWCLFTLATLLLLRNVVQFEKFTASFCRTARLHLAWNVTRTCVIGDDVFVWSDVLSSGAYCQFHVRCDDGQSRLAVSTSDVFQTNDTLICAPKNREYVNQTVSVRFEHDLDDGDHRQLGELDSVAVLEAAIDANRCDAFEYALEPVLLLSLALSLAAGLGLLLRCACVQRRTFLRKKALMHRRLRFADDSSDADVDDGFSVQLSRR